ELKASARGNDYYFPWDFIDIMVYRQSQYHTIKSPTMFGKEINSFTHGFTTWNRSYVQIEMHAMEDFSFYSDSVSFEVLINGKRVMFWDFGDPLFTTLAEDGSVILDS